ncbi:hypothetical protein F-liban_329 [Faustovirus]|nr:hypothetical protein F-liban_329 [Faustovirus]
MEGDARLVGLCPTLQSNDERSESNTLRSNGPDGLWPRVPWRPSICKAERSKADAN